MVLSESPKTLQIGHAGLGTDLERFCRLASGGNWLRAQPPQKYPSAAFAEIRELALSVSYKSHAKRQHIMPLLRLRFLRPGE